MKILIDECIPRRFKRNFPGHDCWTAPEIGCAGKRNGELLRDADKHGFELFITVDRGIEYQSNLAGFRIAVIVLCAPSNRLQDLLPLLPQCLAQIRGIQPGRIVRIGD
jgi:hypothetical protein